MLNDTSITFPTTYEESVRQFQGILPLIQRRWPAATLQGKAVSEDEDLQIQWIAADPTGTPQRLLILSTGLHGVEGFVGAAMRSLFIREFLDKLDPATTGLLLLNNLNPWGMKHQRRVNANNIDLNRNFMDDKGEFEKDFNPDYQLFDRILNPKRPLASPWWGTSRLIASVLVNSLRYGFKGLRGAALLGQNSNPQGLYYSGRNYQIETLFVRDLIEDSFSKYPEVTFLDMHTGYGPRYQMSIVNSPNESRDQTELREAFQYPLIIKADPEQFYSMKGDMIDWTYRHQRSAAPQIDFYGATFEFGVYGDGIPNEIRSVRTMIFENQAVHQGTVSDQLAAWIKQELLGMYYPHEDDWREKALADCYQAFRGVLVDRGFFLLEGDGEEKAAALI